MSKVTAKFQITIPPHVRTQLGIVPGSDVDIRKEGDRYVLLVDPVAELKKNGGVNLKPGNLPMNT
ncbi:hypothetical protein D1AOALGA4SA_2127 [Olavius algarvensis Delta 1 endosymbiont]|nr:hypothetical protein D1AOALGA4SA_2127 [Olavius algarvensis Delta 1 endosymbiont]